VTNPLVYYTAIVKSFIVYATAQLEIEYIFMVGQCTVYSNIFGRFWFNGFQHSAF